MNPIDEDDHGRLEDLMRDLPLAEPSRQMDRRMERLLRPRTGRVTALVYGFAAGVLVSVGVMSAWPRPVVPSPIATVVQVASPAAHPSSSARVLAVSIAPHETVTEMEGSIGGVPVRIQRKQSWLNVAQTAAGPDQWRSKVTLPQVVTISQIRTY